MKFDTFSANSLKILDKSVEEFEKKYIHKLDFFSQKSKEAKIGEKIHALICQYLLGFDVKKLINCLNKNEKELFLKFSDIFFTNENFIKIEENFLVKEKYLDKVFYLSGRFDAIAKENDEIIIYDWKMKNIPKNPENDLQTIVYLNCGAKIFNTQKISLCYFSLENQEKCKINYDPSKNYIEVIGKIIKKLPNNH